jgi:hypothetical protein
LHNFINHNDTPFLIEIPQQQKTGDLPR